ncbi:hypothetical protein HELRODRAFT_173128 [Helobdella robusta]|uniref:Reverse transcriptase domain-containing protein n=1 Tax=Helobdella robusta TaxID=6412 RepID=T1F6E9_HELRO|nr:hypothetical protein HELRODRAFT_173128 [Helobdella robusta]ESO04054.1 hypothetical protein HELRODRAFT_173128 [Helobdella robusta]
MCNAFDKLVQHPILSIKTMNGTTIHKSSRCNFKMVPVHSFFYLGSIITDDAECIKDIRARHGKAQGLAAGLQKISKSHSIALNTKILMLCTKHQCMEKDLTQGTLSGSKRRRRQRRRWIDDIKDWTDFKMEELLRKT